MIVFARRRGSGFSLEDRVVKLLAEGAWGSEAPSTESWAIGRESSGRWQLESPLRLW